MRSGVFLARFVLIWFSATAALAFALPQMRTDVAPQAQTGEPIEVSAALIVSDIMGGGDDLNQQISLDLGATFSWTDPRLAGLEGCRFGRTQIWVPEVTLRNSSTCV